MRTTAEIVREYRKRGYSDEKIRIIALSRPEGLRAKILEYIEEHPGLAEGESGVVKQYLPLRKDDEGEGGTGAVPEEEPVQTEDDAVVPVEVPEVTAEPVEAPLPRAELAEVAELPEKDLILALAHDDEGDQSEDEDEGREAEVLQIEEIRTELAKAKRRETTLVRKADKLSEEMKVKEERVRSLELREEEFDRVAERDEQSRQQLEEREEALADLERQLEAQEAKLEEAAGMHTDEMHRIIDAYEHRIKVVRAHGLKANLVAFASAACVLLVFLVSLALREHKPDAVILPLPDLVVDNSLVEEEQGPVLVADGTGMRRTDLVDMMRAEDTGVRRGFNLVTGEEVAPADEVESVHQDPTPVPGGDARVRETGERTQQNVIRYVVKKNDNLWNICETYLNSGSKWKDVQRDNRLRSTRVNPGQVIMINLKHKQ